MLNRRQKLGQTGEAMAERHLKKMGYQILERNYRNRLGEIDLIARDKGTLVFVEVKTRRSDRYGGPRFAITAQKQKKLSITALSYLKQTQQINCKARFDVVLIKTAGNSPEIETIQNAFGLCYD
ncbi:MAG TPA: YraN family protein [Desulfosalsimonadaceae bacterium]|nr:YraN family protein [Desulfosalsimonadaceae bacterium]